MQYVDHNLLQADERNAEDHVFLRSAARRFGLWYSKPGNGVSHPMHMQRFGVPGTTLAGSDSHTCAAGSLGMLAIGAGGLDVAMAMAGRAAAPDACREIWGVRLTGRCPPWVSAKDVDPGDAAPPRRQGRRATGSSSTTAPAWRGLTAMDRHVIANMGAELGATTTVFPADDAVRGVPARRGPRGRLRASSPPTRTPPTTSTDEIDLSTLQPLIATPGLARATWCRCARWPASRSTRS